MPVYIITSVKDCRRSYYILQGYSQTHSMVGILFCMPHSIRMQCCYIISYTYYHHFILFILNMSDYAWKYGMNRDRHWVNWNLYEEYKTCRNRSYNRSVYPSVFTSASLTEHFLKGFFSFFRLFLLFWFRDWVVYLFHVRKSIICHRFTKINPYGDCAFINLTTGYCKFFWQDV